MLDRLGLDRAADAHRATADAAIDGADFVLIQLRVGGQAARLVDETLPPTFGIIGQETTGAGGFAKALRTVPVVLDLAELVARRAAPGAWIVDFTNPVGIVTQALLDDGHRAIGLCNVAISLQRRLAARFGVDAGARRARARRAQPPDLGARGPGRWRRPAARAARERRSTSWQPSCGCRPTLLAVARRDPVVLPALLLPDADGARRAARRAHTRAGTSSTSRRRLLELYRDPALDEKPALLDDRGGAFYSEAAAQLIASLHDGRGDVQVVDVRNDGALPDLPADAVVEVPARVDRDGAHPMPTGAAGAGTARARPSGQGLRGADRRGRTNRRPRRSPSGAGSESAGRCRGGAARCSTRCSRPIGRICRGSSSRS